MNKFHSLSLLYYFGTSPVSYTQLETAPILKWQVKVYASTSPDFIPEENPVATINIAKGKKTIVTNDPSQRYY